jgi:hypothetical protein
MLKEIKRDLKKVPQEAYDFFVAHTPKKTGNARSKTKLRGQCYSSRLSICRSTR